MKLPNKRTPLPALALAPAFALLCAATPALAGSKLTLNGKTASTDVRVIGGSAYVKLADLAKALDMMVVKTASGYELKKAGGATPIAGVSQGKIGDVLFDGRWRLQVLSVAMPDSYTMTTDAELYDFTGLSSFDRGTRVVKPKAGNMLVVIQCRVTNGQNSVQRLWTAISDEAKVHTALADMSGSSHPPIGYDYEGGPNQTKPLVFGASVNFPILFSVPQGTRLNDLIFTLRNNDTFGPGNDVRVSLNEQAAQDGTPTPAATNDTASPTTLPVNANPPTGTKPATGTKPPAKPAKHKSSDEF